MLRRFMMFALALALAVPACAQGDDTDEATEATPEATAAAKVVTVTAIDYGYTGLPAAGAKAGTKLELKNSGKEVHEIVAWPLKADDKRTLLELSKLDEKGTQTLGPPATVLVAIPGKPVVPAVGDGTLATAGRYYFACFIQKGVDPVAYEKAMAESKGEGPVNIPGAGPPHVTLGMFGEATLTAY